MKDETQHSADGERIAKVLARAGVASRRDAEKMIEAGRVAVNGAVLTTPAFKVPPGAFAWSGPAGLTSGVLPRPPCPSCVVHWQP